MSPVTGRRPFFRSSTVADSAEQQPDLLPEEPSADEAAPPLRRAVVLMTVSSILVPAAGVVAQPILAQALGVAGRGALAAALAPSLLAVAVATLGLPEALTYYLAKHPGITRPALFWASVVSVGLGVVCLVVSLFALPFLSTGNADLGRLILLGMAFNVPALIVGVLRGAATGRQMWGVVTAERLVNTVLRIIAFTALWLSGDLTVLVALWVSCLCPVVAGVVYWRLLLRPPPATAQRFRGGTLRLLVTYGNKVWLGSVASMLLARIGQLLIAPLSSVDDLGLYSVASTISDMPLIVALGIAGALFGVNSMERDAGKVILVSRLTLLVSVAGCVALAAVVPWLVGPLFGAGFAGAVIPTIMLTGSAVLCVPGLMAATGLGAWGRPGLRSLGLAVTLVVNIGALVLLVPPLGVIGACWTSIISNVVMTGYMAVVAGRVMEVSPWDFLLVRGSDVARAWAEGTRLVTRVLRRGPARAEG